MQQESCCRTDAMVLMVLMVLIVLATCLYLQVHRIRVRSQECG